MKLIDRLRELDARNMDAGPDARIHFAFEMFPCKTAEETITLYNTFRQYKMMEPSFCSVSWGQRGQTADKSLEIASAMQNVIGIETQLHLTSAGYAVEQVTGALERAKALGIRNIFALRGAEEKNPDAKFRYAIDLVRYIKETYGDYFGISVAGYPGGYPGCTPEEDLNHLREKLEAGADLVLTPMIYDPDAFMSFVKDCRAHGITCPIFVGIMPILDYAQWTNMVRRAKTIVPQSIFDGLEAVKNDPAAVMEYGIRTCVQLCQELVNRGHRYFYMYTMDVATAVPHIVTRLGWAPEKPAKPFPWEAVLYRF